MADEIAKVVTPRGEGRSMTDLSSPTSGYPSAAPGQGANWFGPLAPMAPVAPAVVAGRALDFLPGFNLNTQPRPYEEVPFHALRRLADSYDPLRIVIEKRKDQLTRVPWTIRVKHEDAGKRPTRAQLPPATRARIADIKSFFERPAYDSSFRQLLRGLAEDLYVIDAPALFLRRDNRGTLTGLQQIDGSLIKRVIDDWGRTPEPREWSGEPFEWNGQTVTRQNFTQIGFRALNGMAWPPIAQQVLKGLPAANLTALEILYRPLNVRPGRTYGMSPVEQVMMTVSIALRRSTSQLTYFTEGNQPDALYSLPETWSPDQIQRYQDYFDSIFAGNLANRRRLKFVADGEYIPLKEPPLKNQFDEWLVRIICAAFSYPPTAFLTLNNRSTAEQHDRTGEEEGLESTKQWAADLFNEVISTHLGEDDIEFAWVEEDEIDQSRQAEILNSYAANGILTLNQVRERLGEEPDPDPAANKLMVKTATGYVPIGQLQTQKEPVT